MTTEMWLTMGVGAVAGFFAGRIWAEFRRARYDMDRIWRTRKNYRDG
jgi:hypothetical protein